MRRAAFWLPSHAPDKHILCNTLVKRNGGITLPMRHLVKGVPNEDKIFVPDLCTEEQAEFLRINRFRLFLVVRPEVQKFIATSNLYDYCIQAEGDYFGRIEHLLEQDDYVCL